MLTRNPGEVPATGCLVAGRISARHFLLERRLLLHEKGGRLIKTVFGGCGGPLGVTFYIIMVWGRRPVQMMMLMSRSPASMEYTKKNTSMLMITAACRK